MDNAFGFAGSYFIKNTKDVSELLEQVLDFIEPS